MLRAAVLAGAALALAASPALGVQGPPIPITQFAWDFASDQATVNAGQVEAANKWMEDYLAANPWLGVAPDPVAILSEVASEVEADLAPPRITSGPVEQQASVGSAATGLRINFGYDPLSRNGAVVGARVLLIPRRLQAYSAIIRINRIDRRDGVPYAIGLPVYAHSDTDPARSSVWSVGAPCRLGRRTPNSFYISVTAAILGFNGTATSGTRYSHSVPINC